MNLRTIPASAIRSLAAESFADTVRYLARSRVIPFIIVSSFAGLMASTAYIATEAALTQQIGEPPDWMDALMVLQWIMSYCGQLMIWIVCAAVVHLMAVIFDGNGSFTDLLFFWGYGYIPLLVSAIILFQVISTSVDTFAALAITSSERLDTIAGMTGVKVAGFIAQSALPAWGTYTIARIHKLSVLTSALCLVIPLGALIGLRYLFQMIL